VTPGPGRAGAQAPPVPLPAGEHARPPTAEIAAAFTAVYLVWGSTFLAIRYAVETVPPFAMMAGRCLLGGIILLGLALVRERGLEWPAAREWGGALVVGGFLFVGCHGVLAYAEQHVPSGLAALCLATIPLFVPLLAWALPGGTAPSRRRAVALVAGFGGVALLVAAQGTGGGLHAGDALLLLASSLSWAAGTVATRVVPVPRSPVVGAALPLLAGGIVLSAVALGSGELAGGSLDHVSTRSAAGFAYLVVLGTVVTFSAYVWLLRHVAPARVATYAFVNPAVAVVIGWALAGESLSAGAVLATVVIIAAVAVAVSERTPAAASS
jgi:drug/metabolite transporter (DMT)-like permease